MKYQRLIKQDTVNEFVDKNHCLELENSGPGQKRKTNNNKTGTEHSCTL